MFLTFKWDSTSYLNSGLVCFVRSGSRQRISGSSARKLVFWLGQQHFANECVEHNRDEEWKAVKEHDIREKHHQIRGWVPPQTKAACCHLKWWIIQTLLKYFGLHWEVSKCIDKWIEKFQNVSSVLILSGIEGIKIYWNVSRCIEMIYHVSKWFIMYRNTSRCIEIYRDVLKCIEMYWNVTRCIEMYQDVSKYIKMYWNVLKCIEMYWNVSRCIEMYRDVSICIESIAKFIQNATK